MKTFSFLLLAFIIAPLFPDVSVLADSATLFLSPGWNMISIEGGVVEVQEFINQNPSCEIFPKIYWYNSSLSKYETVTKLEPLKGYWVFAQNSCQAKLPIALSVSYLSSIDLSPGWNMISPHKISSSFIQFSNNCQYFHKLYWWDGKAGEYKALSSKKPLEPWKGYWVFVRNDCTLYHGITSQEKELHIVTRKLYDKTTGFQGILGKGNILITEILFNFPELVDEEKSKFLIYDIGGRKLGEEKIKKSPKFEIPIFVSQWNSKNRAAGVYLAITRFCNNKTSQCKEKRDKFIILPTSQPFQQLIKIDIEKVNNPGSKFKFTLWESDWPDKIENCNLTFVDEDGKIQKIPVVPIFSEHSFTKSFNKAGVHGIDYSCRVIKGQASFVVSADFKMFYVDFQRKYTPDNFYEILYVPINWSQGEKSQFERLALQSFDLFISKRPMRGKANRIKYSLLEPKDCQDKIDKTLSVFKPLSIVYKCAIASQYKDSFEIAVGICKNQDCLGPGVLGLGAIPDEPARYDEKSATVGMTSVSVPNPEVILHEMGHNFGLYHLDFHPECPAPGACRGPNKEDCLQPLSLKKTFIMDYCEPHARYGPKAQEYLKEIYFAPFLIP